MKKNKKLFILVNYLSFFLSHRLPIAKAALAKGYDVSIGYGELRGADPKQLKKLGFNVYFIPMQPGGVNLIKDLKTFYFIWNFLRKLKPDIVHLVTIKPYLYGGIASRILGVPCLVSAVSGLGTLFIDSGLRSKILRLLLYPVYKLAFNHSNQIIILQNKSDLDILIKWGVLNSSKVRLLKGSGVILKKFTKLNEPSGIPNICFAARLLRDKGVYEFISAAKIFKKKGITANFYLAGDLDTNNPTGLNPNDLENIKKDGFVKILGFHKDIPSLYANSNIICLPSYREGFPKSLMEAAAARRAVVTTNVPGCRDVIIPNKTGLIVPLKNPKKLADALEWLIKNPKERIKMGIAGRKLAEEEFQIEKFVSEHINIYQNLLENIHNEIR